MIGSDRLTVPDKMRNYQLSEKGQYSKHFLCDAHWKHFNGYTLRNQKTFSTKAYVVGSEHPKLV